MIITTIELPTNGIDNMTRIHIPLSQAIVESKRELIEETFGKYMFQLSTQENINKLINEISDLFIKEIRKEKLNKIIQRR